MTDTEGVRRLFDELAGEYDQHVPFFATFGRELVAWCGLGPGQRVLDVAAGRGAIAGPAARAVGPRGAVLAIDNAPNMLRALAADHGDLPQLATCLMDAHRLGIPDVSFDAVTCGFTLHILDDPGEVIAEAYRVLRPGGLLAFSGPPTGQPPDRPRDKRWAFRDQLMADMGRRAAERRKPEPCTAPRRPLYTPPPRPLPEICAQVGFTAIEQRPARASFALRDPQHYWDWSMSHGFRGFVYSLGPRLADEFKAGMFAGLERIHAEGGITLDDTIAFVRAAKPAG